MCNNNIEYTVRSDVNFGFPFGFNELTKDEIDKELGPPNFTIIRCEKRDAAKKLLCTPMKYLIHDS